MEWQYAAPGLLHSATGTLDTPIEGCVMSHLISATKTGNYCASCLCTICMYTGGLSGHGTGAAASFYIV